MPETSDRQSVKRRQPILFWIFLLATVPLTVAVLGYASGYSFNPETQQIVVTSAISVETTPKDSEVYVNGELLGPTPLYENELSAGQYTIRVSREGYYSWEKNLWIEEGKTQIFPDVLLISQQSAVVTQEDIVLHDQPQPLAKDYYDVYRENGFMKPKRLQVFSGPLSIIVDPQQGISYIIDAIDNFSDDEVIEQAITDARWNDNILAYITGHELWVYDSETEIHTLITRNSSSIQSIVWHPDGGYIFFSDSSGIHAIELDGRDKRQTWKIADSTDATRLTILENSENMLYFKSKGETYSRELYELR